MRRSLHAIAFAALVTTFASAATPPIDPGVLLDHIKFLASDELKGRGDGSPELERAAEYIAKQFTAAGLTPGGASQDWFQPFELQAGLEVGGANSLVVNNGRRSISLPLGPRTTPSRRRPTRRRRSRRPGCSRHRSCLPATV